MFRIRRIFDSLTPVNKEALQQVQQILRAHFRAAPQGDIEALHVKLHDPVAQHFRAILFVAETVRRKVLGCAMVHHHADLNFCFLDYLATAQRLTGGGIGGALYQRIREEAVLLEARGVFFECLPDERAGCPDETLLADNALRLRFYERYAARPIVDTGYELPVKPGDTCMPHLVYDGLDRRPDLPRDYARRVVRAILERKYRDLCPPRYVSQVVASFKDDPVRLRPPRYHKANRIRPAVAVKPSDRIALVVNDQHSLHEVHERGYVESPVRIRSILGQLEGSGLFDRIAPRPFAESHIRAVHDADFVRYLHRSCRGLENNQSLYPYVFPIRNKLRPPRERSVLAGYYCIDTFTPLSRNAYLAARRGVDCALTAAQSVLEGRALAYALVRPPGHHAERRSFGGFCYFNNAAVAAHYLSAYGRVAILDLDYHHGNGQQNIFYARADVLTVSLHGHPSFAYPYFSGFEEEQGEGPGTGFNRNFPMPEALDGARYRRTLCRAVALVEAFAPGFLVIALGLDTAKGDPTGTWSLKAIDFKENGRLIGELAIPTMVVQEGGYRTRTLGTNARNFFDGLTSRSRRSFIEPSAKRTMPSEATQRRPARPPGSES